MIVEIQRGGHIQRLSYDDFEARVRDGEISPEARIRLESVNGPDFRPAREVELFRSLDDPDAAAFRRRFSQVGLPLVTAILVGIQIRVYLWSHAPGADSWLEAHFTNWGPGVLEAGEVHRLLSYGFLHVAFTHLLFNILFLAYTGWNLERALGRASLLVLFCFSVMTGGFLSMWMAPDRPALGASGGDFGLLAAVVLFGWRWGDLLPTSARKYFGYALVPYVAFSLTSGLTAENVDNWGHLGGLAGGVFLGALLGPELPREEARNRRVRAMAWGLMVLGSVALWAGGPRMVPLESVPGDGWSADRPTYWREGWTFLGDRGWFSPTGKAALVIATTTQPRPTHPEEVALSLVQRVESGAHDVVVRDNRAWSVGGVEGRRLRLDFELAGEQQTMDALVLSRGVVEHRVVFQSVSVDAARYAPLVERVFESLSMADPEELVDARTHVAANPDGWSPEVELGQALYHLGDAAGALTAYDQALASSPGQPKALEGRLRVFVDYQRPGGAVAAREALLVARYDPLVIVAAAEALRADGAEDEARAALDQAWASLPGDRTLRRARLQWGLSVDLPGAPPEAPAPEEPSAPQ